MHSRHKLSFFSKLKEKAKILSDSRTKVADATGSEKGLKKRFPHKKTQILLPTPTAAAVHSMNFSTFFYTPKRPP